MTIKSGWVEMATMLMLVALLASLAVSPQIAQAQNAPYAFTSIAEDGRPTLQRSTEAFLAGTRVGAELAPAVSSAASVPVIVILTHQPLREVAEEVQNRYIFQVRANNAEVRKILARYAGSRKFNSTEEMRAQAALEVSAVTPSDRSRIRTLNQDADTLLDSMRKDISQKLRDTVDADQSKVAAHIASMGGIVNYGYSVQNSMAAIIPGTSLAAISRHPLVSRIVEDRLSEEHMNVSGPSIFVNSFWTPGYDGGIWDGAIMDTGVDTSHPALDDDTVGTRTWYSHTFHATAVGWTEGYGDDPASTDDLQGHGTHVAGTMLSSNATYRGIAFGGDTGFNLKAGFRKTDAGGACYQSDAQAALDWSWQQAEEPDVVNHSFGGDTADEDDTSCQYWDSYVESKAVSGVISAGNSGPGALTLSTPGIAYNVITVASMNDMGTTSRTTDTISGFSSLGPTTGGRRKPDISAPGDGIMSTNAFWEGGGSDFVSKSGTSMAAPHIAGATLLLCDAGVTDPREVKALLINTADDWGTSGWDATYGWGYVNLAEAYLHRADSALYTVNERGAYDVTDPGNYSKLFKTTGMDAGDKGTMVWYRHAVYNGASDPTTVYSLNDLNLRLYDETNNALIDSDLTGPDNVQQVVSNRSSTQVIRAYAWTTNFSHASNSETFALAYPEGTTLASDPTVTPSANNYTPPLYAKFSVTVSVNNSGDVAAHNVSVTLSLPAGVTLAEGSLTQNIGTINAGSTYYASYTLDTTSAGAKTVNISTTSSSYGLTFTGSGSFTVTPGAQDTVDPYTTMRIGQPTYQTGGTDKVTNGGFESNLASWTTSGTAAIESGSAHSGSKNLKLGSGTGSAYQTLIISAGAYPAVLTFWYKSSISLWANVGCSIQSSGGTNLAWPFSTVSTQASWTKVTVDVSRFKGQTIRLNFYSSAFLSTPTLYVDDVTLKEGEQVWVEDTNQHSLAAYDDNSGVDYTQYHIGADPYATYSAPFTLVGRPENYNYVYYRSVDNSGNYEPTTTGVLRLDTSAPKSVLWISGPKSFTGGTEKVLNGGFESLLADWTTSGAVTTVSSPVRTGRRAARVGATGAGSIYQDVAINKLASRAFLRLHINSIASPDASYIMVSVIDPLTGDSCFAAGFNSTADWTEWAWDVSRFKGKDVRVQVDVIVTSGAAATAYVDDVSVVENADAYISPYTVLRISSAELCGVQTYESKIDAGAYAAGQSFSIASSGVHDVRYRALDNLDHQESDVLTQLIVDNKEPTVTINQASGQADPTNTSPINFTVVFSESVSDFATGDVTITGTAGGTKTATVTGSGTTYNVAVSGMTSAGAVIAEIAASVAHDGIGNANLASTSTYNTVTFLVLRTLSANVTLKNWIAASPLVLPFQVKYRKSGTSDTPAVVDLNLTVTPSAGVGTASFGLADLLPGAYDVWVKSSHWLAGKLTGIDVTAGDSTDKFFSLTNADINGDNAVNFSDYLILQTHYKKAPGTPSADVNGDGAVNFSDYLILQATYKQTGATL